MLLVLLATLSRSGALGLLVGLLVLVLPYRRFVWSRALLAPLGALALLLAYILYSRWHFFSVVLRSRDPDGRRLDSTHFAVYDFIPQMIHSHPLLGLGLNNFSVYYEFVTGKTNWGPHSYWVSIIVETGLIGFLLFLVFLRYVFLRLRAARALGRMLDAAGDPNGRRVRPLAWGFTAALLGTMAANFFYLTMQFYYFYGFWRSRSRCRSCSRNAGRSLRPLPVLALLCALGFRRRRSSSRSTAARGSHDDDALFRQSRQYALPVRAAGAARETAPRHRRGVRRRRARARRSFSALVQGASRARSPRSRSSSARSGRSRR